MSKSSESWRGGAQKNSFFATAKTAERHDEIMTTSSHHFSSSRKFDSLINIFILQKETDANENASLMQIIQCRTFSVPEFSSIILEEIYID